MERLRKNSDFSRVYSRGRSSATHNLVLYWYPNKFDYNRVGFSISKRVGNAIVRNKIRRRLKEIVRLKEKLKGGYDIIFIARKPVVNIDYQRLEKDVTKLFIKAGILKE